jgi:uncharacterized protein YbjQ (UPF0145 family)
MIVTTTNTLGDQDIVETVGMVRGSTTWRRRILKSYQGGIRSVQQSGQLDFDKALDEIKKQAMQQMVKSAKQAGATAIVGMQEQVNEVTDGVFMVSVMGTAVRCQPKQETIDRFETANDNGADFSHVFNETIMAAGSAYCH